MKIFLILPIHLFEFNEYLKSMDKIYIIEDPFYFINNQHKQKLILHRSSMKYYYNKISKIYKNVSYVEYDKINYDFLLNNDVFMFDPIDKPIIKKGPIGVFC